MANGRPLPRQSFRHLKHCAALKHSWVVLWYDTVNLNQELTNGFINSLCLWKYSSLSLAENEKSTQFLHHYKEYSLSFTAIPGTLDHRSSVLANKLSVWEGLWCSRKIFTLEMHTLYHSHIVPFPATGICIPNWSVVTSLALFWNLFTFLGRFYFHSNSVRFRFWSSDLIGRNKTRFHLHSGSAQKLFLGG